MPYLAYLHSHVFLVVLYAVLFLVKLIFLLTNNTKRLNTFRKRTRILEMILPALFLFTGVMLAIKGGEYDSHWFWAKMMALVMVVIMGVQTFRKNSKGLGVFTLILLMYIFAVSYTKTPVLKDRRAVLNKERKEHKIDLEGATPEEHGKYLFSSMGCANCHGENGDKGYAGASDLRKSTIAEPVIKEVIREGRKNMPSFGKFFNEGEMNAVSAYVRSLQE